MNKTVPVGSPKAQSCRLLNIITAVSRDESRRSVESRSVGVRDVFLVVIRGDYNSADFID